jgi:sarcosine/dimethylglycine N-methyltransferase
VSTQDDRARFDEALAQARTSAYPPGEFVGQESFMRAGEILRLAEGAGIGPGVSVLDLCCGVAGPGRFLTARLGCSYLGVDASAAAVQIARDRADGLPCRFQVGRVPPVPPGPFDVVLMLETILAFEDKDGLLREVVAQLAPGGRFAFTLEEGEPLSEQERAGMPDADTVWLTPLSEMLTGLDRAGLRVRRQEDLSHRHLEVVEAMLAGFAAHRGQITGRSGTEALDDLVTAHAAWRDWLRTGRVRKLAFVTERPAAAG